MPDDTANPTLSNVEPYTESKPSLLGPAETPKEVAVKQYTIKEFFENVPPGKQVIVSDFTIINESTTLIRTPQLNLYCSNEKCKGVRFFDAVTRCYPDQKSIYKSFIDYCCRNCGRSFKTYALNVTNNPSDPRRTSVFKYGEHPSFGPPTPSKASKLIKGEKELFLFGRKCENQGMGIGAFIYYRRVIESQKNRIFDKMIRVIKKVSPGNDVIEELKAAKEKKQFTRAVESIKTGLPDSLLINGHNPLLLLHSALSAGVHEHDDAKCLELANAARTVLFEFADRLGQALKEDTSLNDAISKLAKK
jgi:hypothetical protein